MLGRQHFVDLERESGSSEDPKPWPSGNHQQPSPHHISANAPAGSGDFDRVLFKNLVEMVPLVESLMDRKVSTSFTRRASLIYTRTPSRESHHQKVVDGKGRKTQPVSARKRVGDNGQHKNENSDSVSNEISTYSSEVFNGDRARNELLKLQQQIEDLQKKLSEKDELLMSAEGSINQLKSLHSKLDELKRQVAEKDSLLKSSNMKLSDAKINLADKQAALEKLQWEVANANTNAAKLQQDLDSVECEAATIMEVIEALGGTDGPVLDEKKSRNLDYFDKLLLMAPEEVVDEIDTRQMEEARLEYVAAVAHAKENPSEETLAMAAEARFRLQSFVLGVNSMFMNDAARGRRISISF